MFLEKDHNGKQIDLRFEAILKLVEAFIHAGEPPALPGLPVKDLYHKIVLILISKNNSLLPGCRYNCEDFK